MVKRVIGFLCINTKLLPVDDFSIVLHPGATLTDLPPKTERFAGHEGRTVPIFPELRPYLYQCAETAEDGAQLVITKHRPNRHNLRTRFHRIIKRADLVPWEKVFQNLRSSRETELLEKFPIQTVVAWLGNSPKVALQSYLQVRESDFESAVRNDATCAADQVGINRTGIDKAELGKDICPNWSRAYVDSPARCQMLSSRGGTRTRTPFTDPGF